jgi:acetyltransferase-like isoleucine patch superfamily enzyme/dTDP-4-dehydrorhamnose 3,5-epimerase-like enzyme
VSDNGVGGTAAGTAADPLARTAPEGDFFQHPMALVESSHIGAGSRVWAFAHVLPGAVIGRDCNICDGVFVENDVVVGDRVTVKCGVQLWDGVRLEDDVFVGPNATFTNDRFPRSREYPEQFPPTIVRRGASIGANATILPGLEIGTRAMVGAGAVVTRSVPAHAVVAGNPARVVSWVDAHRVAAAQSAPTPEPAELPKLRVAGARLYRLPMFQDPRGLLSFGQVGDHLPFDPKRWFIVTDVRPGMVRGEHAHREQHQYLVAVRGSCHMVLDDGERRDEIVLHSRGLGLHVPPMIWGTLFGFSPDALLLVLTSGLYDAAEYIRDYAVFSDAVAKR